MNGDGYVIGGAWTSNPMHLSNISDLAKRNRVHICGQTGFCGHIADKIERRNMEENEKCKHYPTSRKCKHKNLLRLAPKN